MRERYLSACRARGLRPATLALRANLLERAERELGGFDDITAERVYGWFEQHDNGPATRVLYWRELRLFFRWCVREGHLEREVLSDALPPRVRRNRPRPVDLDELELVLANAREPMRSWFVLAAYAGLRAGEVSRVEASHLERWPRGYVLLVPEGKGGVPGHVPAHPRVVELLLEHRGREGRLWPITPHTLTMAASEELRRLGVGFGGLHRLRHTFATGIYARTQDLRVTQEVMRHASVSTTVLYVALSDDATFAAVAGL